MSKYFLRRKYAIFFYLIFKILDVRAKKKHYHEGVYSWKQITFNGHAQETSNNVSFN